MQDEMSNLLLRQTV